MMSNNNTPAHDLFMIRESVESDRPFILATWLKGLKFGSIWYKLIDDKIYYRVYHAVIETLLNKPGVVVKVACLKEDPQVILGYGVFENNKIHWVQVKKAWRNIGIARSLVPKEANVITHTTDIGISIFTKKGWTFNPFLLF